MYASSFSPSATVHHRSAISASDSGTLVPCESEERLPDAINSSDVMHSCGSSRESTRRRWWSTARNKSSAATLPVSFARSERRGNSLTWTFILLQPALAEVPYRSCSGSVGFSGRRGRDLRDPRRGRGQLQRNAWRELRPHAFSCVGREDDHSASQHPDSDEEHHPFSTVGLPAILEPRWAPSHRLCPGTRIRSSPWSGHYTIVKLQTWLLSSRGDVSEDAVTFLAIRTPMCSSRGRRS